jgi:hypothetical protein
MAVGEGKDSDRRKRRNAVLLEIELSRRHLASGSYHALVIEPIQVLTFPDEVCGISG